MEIKPFRLLAAERFWGWEIAGLERKGRGARIRWGWQGKCITFRLVLFSEIGSRLEKWWKTYHYLGRGQWVSFLSFACLLRGQGLGFVCRPILPACLCVSFHSHLVTDPVLHVNDLQNTRAVLGLSEKRKDPPPSSAALSLLLFIQCVPSLPLSSAGHNARCRESTDVVFAFMVLTIKHWLFRTGYTICMVWYRAPS